MENHETLLVKLHQAEQRKATWEWTRDQAEENIRQASRDVSQLRLELGQVLAGPLNKN